MRRIRAILLAFFWTLAAAAAPAQTPDFAEFDRLAASVESSLAGGELTASGYDSLREALVEWRERLLEAQDVNSVQVEALEAQLATLGPAPAEGATEADALAARRAELQAALEKARAPQLDAVEAHARADALIGRIDTAIRRLQTDALFELKRTPLDPTLWTGALTAIVGIAESVRSEVMETFSEGADRGEIWQRAALAVLLLGAALLLILRGPLLVERFLARIEARSGSHGPVVYGFLISFASVMLTMAGISLVNLALISTGILGETGRATAIGINAAILAYAVAHWLGGRIFPERSSIPSPLRLNERLRARGRKNAGSLGFLAGLLTLISVLNQSVGLESETLGVIALPIYVLLGLVMFRTGRLIRHGGATREGETPTFGGRIALLLGRTVQAIAVAGPLLAAIGFFNLARGVLYPTVLTLGLFAFLMALHFVIRAAFAMARKLDEDAAREALTPVLLSLFLAVAAIPVFALIWGARDSELGEIWSQFRTGIRLGETTISPGDFLTFAIVFALGFGLTRLVQGTLRATVLPRTRIDKGGQNAIVSGLGYLGLTIAAVAAVTAAGIDLSSLAIVVGALGVGIGFGLQNIVNNFVSGIILLVERPVSEGDIIEVGGKLGTVKAISVRSTQIETFDRQDVIVPNGDFISGSVTNWTKGNAYTRVTINVGVAYASDSRRVHDILKEICEAHPLVAAEPPPAVYFSAFGADALDFICYCIVRDVKFKMQVQSDLNHSIHERFREEGIEIPFAQRDVWLRNPEALEKFAEIGPVLPPPETKFSDPTAGNDGEDDGG
jgi:small-conductance mechanosensitive channel